MPRYDIEHVYTGEVLDSIEAETPLAALDAYAVKEGFVPYSELPVEEGDGEWTYTLPDGRLAGIFTNYEISAREAK